MSEGIILLISFFGLYVFFHVHVEIIIGNNFLHPGFEMQTSWARI